jgi:hypothetical protein
MVNFEEPVSQAWVAVTNQGLGDSKKSARRGVRRALETCGIQMPFKG